MAHLLLHAAGVMVLKELRLLHLHDIAQLAAGMKCSDWSEFLDGDRWWAHPPLALAARYFPVIPLEVLEALAERCPRRLRRIQRRRCVADVSFSRLWVDAFPASSGRRMSPRL